MPKMMAIDSAGTTGYAFGERGTKPHCGVFTVKGFSGFDLAPSLGSIYTGVKSLVQANGIEEVAVEKQLPGLVRQNARGIRTPVSTKGANALAMVAGVAAAGAANGGARRVHFVEPSVWREAVYGIAYPKDPKGTALAYCRDHLNLNLTEHNAAEACCILVYLETLQVLV